MEISGLFPSVVAADLELGSCRTSFCVRKGKINVGISLDSDFRFKPGRDLAVSGRYPANGLFFFSSNT